MNASAPITTGVASPAAGERDIRTADGFRLAYRSHGPAVYRYVASRLGVGAAEDVTSEVFVTAWRARSAFDEARGQSIEAWLIGVASNVIARHREKEQRWIKMCRDSAVLEMNEPTHSGDMSDADSRVDAHARERAVLAAVANLPQREREPLLLHTVTEMSYEEIAQALSIPIGTVRSRINRARKRLRRAVPEGSE